MYIQVKRGAVMKLIKFCEKNLSISSEDLKREFTLNEFLDKRKISEIVDELRDVDYQAGVFFGETLTSNDVEETLYRLTEALNIPLFYYDETKTMDEQINRALEEFQWQLSYFDYPKGKEEYSIESLLTVGNGYLGLRGTTPEMNLSDANYPGTYLAGVYNSLTSNIEGTSVVNEDFVNLPNAQKIYLVVDNELINLEDNQVNYLHRNLDLKTGEFNSCSEIILKNGQRLKIETQKFASMENRHFYGIKYRFSLDDSTKNVQLISEIDGKIKNYNVERYRKLASQHLNVIENSGISTQASMQVETTSSKIKIIETSQLFSDQLSFDDIKIDTNNNKVIQSISIDAEKNEWYDVEKIVHVSKDVKEEISFSRYDELFQASKKEWDQLWDSAKIDVSGDLMSQKMLNLHTYHMLVSASPKGNERIDASITARGLHGEAYRGHIFWDELFMMPFYLIHFPETAKQLLMYRYLRLEKAKELAKEEGHDGAMFPWQSGLDGSEQSQKLHLNPLSGEWKEDHSRRQRHVSLAIAYNYWMYFQYTNDQAFLENYGIEMLTEISKFWLSLAKYDSKLKRYVIEGVMGPDEFHEAYLGANEGGLKNNAYTNLMVVWLLDVMEQLSQKYDKQIDLDFEKLKAVKEKLYLEINEDGIIAQFEGYFDLKEIDWEHYRKTYKNIYRMDRILNAEGKSADEFKVAKQADSLMIFYNFPVKKIQNLLVNLGYQLPADFVEKNLDYYLQRTSHGSTLSRVVHSQLAEVVGNRELAWKLYQEALYSDYRDIQGGTTAEGIHTGVMASTLAVTLSDFAGLDIREDVISFEPHLPEKWNTLAFSFEKQGVKLEVSLSKESITILVNKEIEVYINQEKRLLLPNKINKFGY